MRLLAAIISTIVITMAATSAKASLVLLTDTSQLDKAPGCGIHIGSYDAYSFGNLTFQAVNFNTPGTCWDGSVMFLDQGGGSGYMSTAPSEMPPLSGADATNMKNMFTQYRYGGWDLRWSGLEVGQVYKLQIMGSTQGGGSRFARDGATFDVDVSATPGLDADELHVPGMSHYIYTQEFQANGSVVMISMRNGTTGPNGWNMAAASAVSLSQATEPTTVSPIPEPTTVGVLALGVAGMLARRRK